MRVTVRIAQLISALGRLAWAGTEHGSGRPSRAAALEVR